MRRQNKVRGIQTPTDVPDIVAAASVLTRAIRRAGQDVNSVGELVNKVTADPDARRAVGLTGAQRKLIGEHALDLEGLRVIRGSAKRGISGGVTNVLCCTTCGRWMLSETYTKKCVLTLGCPGIYVKSAAAPLEPTERD